MEKGLIIEPSFRSKQINIVSRQYERNAAQKERARVNLKPKKTHRDQIFFIQDRIERGDIGLEYFYTDKMVEDFMTKPLQGGKLFEFRDHIMGM